MKDIKILNHNQIWLLLESLWCSAAAKKTASGFRDCFVRGCKSFFDLSTAAMLVVVWSFFLGLTSMSCLMYLLLSMGSVAYAVRNLGYTHGLLIVGLFTVLVIRMYVNFWVVGPLLIVGGFLFSLNHTRLVVLLAMVYGLYYVKHQMGWCGVLVSISLAFLSNDAINFVLEWSDDLSAKTQSEEQKVGYSFVEDDIPEESKFCVPVEEVEYVGLCKSSSKPTVMTNFMTKQKKTSMISIHVAINKGNAIKEMKRILGCVDHYETLGFCRYKKIDSTLLKKEYKKKAMLVHPDKNMGSLLSCESFKKVQCAYEVLSDSLKKWDYDEHLRNEESKSLSHKAATTDYCSAESRHIQCTKCGHLHIWICTNRTKLKARWCQGCCQYHQARDGDGWVEYNSDPTQKVEIPRAFVCALNKIFDVSEWAICQGMACRPNTHQPSFHVNIVGVEKTQKSKYPWDFDSEMINEEEEFDLWLQQAVATGLFRETSKRRKSWSHFKWSQKKAKKQWTRLS